MLTWCFLRLEPSPWSRRFADFSIATFVTFALILGSIFTFSCGAAFADTPGSDNRIALLIANASYPDANQSQQSALKDATVFADELGRASFDVDLKQDLTRDGMRSSIDAFLAKIKPGTTALIYFNGVGIQVARQTYLIPVNAEIWSEADVKREGTSLDAVVADMNRHGASVKIIVIDASRRNPFERRFRSYSAGLAGIEAPENTLVMYAAAPNKVGPDGTGEVSLFMNELVKEMRTPNISAEDAIMHTRVGVSHASNGEQVPWFASSLADPVYLGRIPETASATPDSGAPSTSSSKPPVLPVTPTPPPKPPILPKAVVKAPVVPPETAPKPIAKAPPTLPDSKPPESKLPETKLPESKTADAGPTEQASEPQKSSRHKTASPKVPPVVPKAPPTVPKVPPTVPKAPPTVVPVQPTKSPDNPPGSPFRDCPDCTEMAVLNAGSFLMGSGGTPFDRPPHRVTIAKPFAIARTEVTFADWARCQAAGGCSFKPDSQGFGEGEHPVINVSWTDAKDYVAWLSRKTGKPYRLPTEAEWEYAARGGTTTTYSWGPTVGTNRANCSDCGSHDSPHTVPVKSFAPNAFGLFDMAGNAAEWVEDCWNASYRGAPKDGSAWLTGTCEQRVLRGGSFDGTAAYAKPSARFRYDSDVRYWANGFRVARDMP